MMAMQGDGINTALAEIVRFFIVIGFFWYLLSNGPAIAMAIIKSMWQIGSEAIGQSAAFTPGGVTQIGFDIFFKVLDQSSVWSPVDSTAGIILGIIILGILTLVGVNLLLLFISAWVLVYGGIFFLGFGGSRWTSDMAINFFKTVLSTMDLEGTAANIVAYAIAESDFVVVPAQGSQLDAEQASRAFGLIRAHERGIQKHKPDYKLPYAVLFTRTSAAIQSRDTRHIRESFKAGDIPFFETELNERAAFKAMFSYCLPLDRLPRDEVSNVEKAIENAESFTREMVEKIA